MTRLRPPVVAAAVVLMAAGCCRNEATFSLAGPDGSRVAVLFHRDCGGIVRQGYQLSVTGASATVPWGMGNAAIFLVPDSTQAGGVQPRTVALRWLSPRRLLVAYDTTNTRAEREAARARGVDIVLQRGIPDSLQPIREP